MQRRKPKQPAHVFFWTVCVKPQGELIAQKRPLIRSLWNYFHTWGPSPSTTELKRLQCITLITYTVLAHNGFHQSVTHSWCQPERERSQLCWHQNVLVYKNVAEPHRQRGKQNSHIASVRLWFHLETISHMRHTHCLWLWQSQTRFLQGSRGLCEQPLG